MTVLKKLLLSALIPAALAGVLSAQSAPDALTPSSTYVGVQPIAVNPDWGCAKGGPLSCWDRHMYGFESYAGLNHVWKRMGVEGTVRLLTGGGVTSDMRESNYIIGPTVRMITRGSFVLSANVQTGLASITLPKGYAGSGHYFMFSPAGFLDERVSRDLSIRYEYESQFWPEFKGALGTHGLSPNGFGVGVTYRLHPRTF
jgi:hypothetical protein